MSLIFGMGHPRWCAAVLLSAAAALTGCGTDVTDGDPTPAPPPTVTAAQQDCGLAPLSRPRTGRDIHVMRGTTNIDCPEALRVIEKWDAAPGGRSAGYFIEIEDWDCTAAGDWQDRLPDQHMMTCERADGALVHLDRP
ncbi:hypothetical protein [Mycolicibacterium arseniciresistens]|uniref:Lipoprotein n=1 Tax=Mycolicibacterium arseniciresistens TaxID=3062257 RepID=A0ABT8UK48_9MYCO|nr:hypothetical protein [Mycolicibacterium arseniciresistens]MDO3637422.1 hypothetical protein [Mycolicibacterium arseniciresistens]